MKNILFLISLIPVLTYAQLPVTDGATNSQLIKLNIQVKTMNNSLIRLINLLEKNNEYTSKSKEILTEELNAKKNAPDYVLKSNEVLSILNLKDEILRAYRSSKQSIEGFKNLNKKETNDFIEYAANTVIKTKKLFKQCETILSTNSIIQPEERLKKIDGINNDLEKLLSDFNSYSDKVRQLNSSRNIRKTLIDLN